MQHIISVRIWSARSPDFRHTKLCRCPYTQHTSSCPVQLGQRGTETFCTLICWSMKKTKHALHEATKIWLSLKSFVLQLNPFNQLLSMVRPRVFAKLLPWKACNTNLIRPCPSQLYSHHCHVSIDRPHYRILRVVSRLFSSHHMS